MDKKLIKILTIAMYIVVIVSLFSNVFAGVSDFKGSLDGGAGVTSAKTAIIAIISSVLGVIRVVGAAVAVIILLMLACKYIIASAGDRADIKKFAVTYIIGSVVMFGASGLATMAKKFVDASTGG